MGLNKQKKIYKTPLNKQKYIRNYEHVHIPVRIVMHFKKFHDNLLGKKPQKYTFCLQIGLNHTLISTINDMLLITITYPNMNNYHTHPIFNNPQQFNVNQL